MNREGAESYLRVLAEAEMRGPMLPAPLPSWPGGPRGTARMAAVAEALTAVSALDAATAADIMADFDLAVAVRQDLAQVRAGRRRRDGLDQFGGTAARPVPVRRHRPDDPGRRAGAQLAAAGSAPASLAHRSEHRAAIAATRTPGPAGLPRT